MRVKKMNLLFQGGYIGDLFRQSAFTSIPSEIFGRNTVGLLKELIEIRYGRKTYIVADRKDRIIGILQLKGCLLQADLIQIFRHSIAGVLPKAAAQIGFVKMERL